MARRFWDDVDYNLYIYRLEDVYIGALRTLAALPPDMRRKALAECPSRLDIARWPAHLAEKLGASHHVVIFASELVATLYSG